mgnify:CR=1 FL=1
MLYHRSGLLGISGLSADTMDLLPVEHDNPRARLALAVYVRSIAKQIATMATTLGGIDLLVFTAGVGEHNATIRERVCAELEWLGARLDPEANARHASVISAPESGFTIAVEATNEEWVAAQRSHELLGFTE